MFIATLLISQTLLLSYASFSVEYRFFSTLLGSAQAQTLPVVYDGDIVISIS